MHNNLKPLTGSKALQAFLNYGLSARGELILPKASKKRKTSICCGEAIYYMRGIAYCGECGHEADTY